MARYHPILGPRTLECAKSARREKQYVDPQTKRAGRCGLCRPCWRLFLWQCRQIGIGVPRARRDGSILGWSFVKFRKAE